MIETDLLGLILTFLARDVVADLDLDYILNNQGHIPALLLWDRVADLLAHGVAFLGVLLAGDLPFIADLLWYLPIYSVHNVVTLLPGDVPENIHVRNEMLLLARKSTCNCQDT